MTKFTVNWQNFIITPSISVKFRSNCPKNTLSPISDSKMFVFSCEGVYEIDPQMMGQPYMVHQHTTNFNGFKVVKFAELVFEVSSN